MSSKLDWKGKKIKAQAGEHTKAVCHKAGFDIEARTKDNITKNNQVDTGFMRNSTYTRTDSSVKGGAKSGRYLSTKTGRSVKRRTAPPASLRGAEAVVGVGAIYAIYQERRKPFMRRAVQDVERALGQIAQAEFKF